MTIARVLYFWTVVLLLHTVFGFPTSPLYKDASESCQSRSLSSCSAPVTGSTFAHLAIDLGLVATLMLASITAAETGLQLMKHKMKTRTSREKEDIQRGLRYIQAQEQSLREDVAEDLLLEMAAIHAGKVSRSFNGKKSFEKFKVPKEIHGSLENIFLRGDEASDAKGFNDLKDALSPLLDFE